LTRTWRSFLALGAGNYGAMAVGVVVSVLLAHRLGTEHYGLLALLLMVSQVLLLVTVNWSHAGFVRFGAREFEGSGAITQALRARLGLVGPTTLLGAAILVLGRYPLAEYLGIPPSAVWLILVHFTAASALSLVGAVFQSRNEMPRYGACLFLDKLIMLTCVLALPSSWAGSAIAALTCYAVSSSLVAIWGVAVVGVRALWPAGPGSVYRSMAAFSLPLLLTSWAGLFGTNWFDLVILKQYVSLSNIGTYSLGVQLAGVAQQVTVIFSTLLLPELSVMVLQEQHERIRTLIERALPYYLLATSILFSVVLIAAPAAVPLIFGTPYTGTAPVLAILMLASCCLAVYNACTPLVSAYGSTWMLTGIAFASTGVNVVMDLVLIPRFGIQGSALATLLAYAACALLVLAFVQRRVGGRVLRLAWLPAPAVLAYGCSLVTTGLWFYVTALCLTVLSVLALIAAFDMFSTEDRVFFRALSLKWPFGLRAGQPAGRHL
jgi:O-antigen/teichoic acid export membrane protein